MRALTVTLNAALDVTYRVAALVPGDTHRVSEVAVRAGGKGVNVARMLRTLGVPVLATGLVGGAAGAALREDLSRSGVPHAMFAIAGETRRTVTVVTGSGQATLFAEPGPVVTPEEWSGFLGHYSELVVNTDVVVLSGSLPQGLPDDAYATLVRSAPVPVVLDADGTALALGAAAGPAVITPNRGELAAASEVDDPLALGAAAALVSDGARGMTAHTADGVWAAAPPEVISGNPTGAGDAAVAALVAGWHLPWPERLAEAVALSAAAVRAPLAGDFDRAFYDQHRADVTPRPVPED
ncbi:1-phosphofructokinase family hexose kinase [Lentzea flaviverrucosa]|uniref:Tagatose 6-phosphate kinase n=1 Tax=Lentzea flaviverrucosa TaxID=200379 RepID=A0A1H9XEU1_9PSEU|nr:hexose kinase [Lentzea flaviverrucosa]RDI21504.1 tagatose 6-phosphate kinase [Lentzea flaviverrucosa]SES44551.1 tagatose 6-phosphate kinase [Lentzea flaviverrucosa]